MSPAPEPANEALISFGLAAVSSHTDPRTYQEAMSREDCDEWKRAAEDEMQSIREAGTYTLVETPSGANIIGNKWVFKKKLKADKSVERYKARLVGKGYNQKEGVDYFETFAPVAKLSSIRALLALATHHDLEIHQMDVKCAFLNGVLEEDIYMEQPQGFIEKGKEHLVCTQAQ